MYWRRKGKVPSTFIPKSIHIDLAARIALRVVNTCHTCHNHNNSGILCIHKCVHMH